MNAGFKEAKRPHKNAHVFTEPYRTAYKAHLEAVMGEAFPVPVRKLMFDAFNAGWVASRQVPPTKSP